MGHVLAAVLREHVCTGKVIRIAPNHISIADPDALQVVYAVRFTLMRCDHVQIF